MSNSTTPFTIEASAPADSFFVAADGDIGLGTSSPENSLHISTTTFGNGLLLDNPNNGNIGIKLRGGTDIWVLQKNSSTAAINPGALIFSVAGTGVQEMFLDTDGDLTIDGTLTTGGTTCGSGCDLVFQPGYDLPSIEEHAAQMWEKSYLPAVGPTEENAPFNVTEKTTGMLNELEHAHIYIEQLHKRVAHLEEQLEKVLAHLAEDGE